MKKRHQDDYERLEKENKELKQENRLLNRRLKRLSRNQNEDSDDEEDEPEERKAPHDVDKKCPECGKGYVVIIQLGPRKQPGCNTCGWRGKITK